MTENSQHGNESQHEPQHNESQPQRLNMLPALLSLFFPGFGQLIQGRAVFMGHAILYMIPLFFLYITIVDNFECNRSRTIARNTN